MDNDILIDQARQLYAALHARQTRLPAANNSKLARLERLVSSAYGRYQRRLNRCVLCYQFRKHDCIREAGKKRIPCQRRNPFSLIAAS
ncbi:MULTISPECIES: hypothetical protein [Methylomonas]|uniref:Uncharacterized protein n=2 Tax=Methylomonas TaxID=416 RepID=A0A140E5B1_9GAMM|nr:MULTISPECIES: hypothetical protein [Methylomonas]AMK75585.1 hypothetical protein JT25_003630 [Methylomonas denitrificans]OAI09215.1 hypothetical protein A1342_08385 [Methylomonas methanica]TCV79082.1 hypothetical protein EDE11_12259 [Methylomonas methanica]